MQKAWHWPSGNNRQALPRCWLVVPACVGHYLKVFTCSNSEEFHNSLRKWALLSWGWLSWWRATAQAWRAVFGFQHIGKCWAWQRQGYLSLGKVETGWSLELFAQSANQVHELQVQNIRYSGWRRHLTQTSGFYMHRSTYKLTHKHIYKPYINMCTLRNRHYSQSHCILKNRGTRRWSNLSKTGSGESDST